MHNKKENEDLLQSKVRLFIVSAILIYTLGIDFYLDKSQPVVYLIEGLLALYAVIIFVLTHRHPDEYPIRRYINIVADVGFGSILIYLFGEEAAIFYPVFLWIIIANGIRFGVSYLYFAIAVGVIGFSFIIFNGSYWIENQYTAYGLLIGIIALPLSSATLIRRLQQAVLEVTAGQEQLKVALGTAESAIFAKDEFLASMSHELRTPLTAIIGNSEFIAEKVNDPEIKELVNSVEMAGRGQLALVNDILDMSKIESGKFTIDEIPYDFAQLLRDVEHMLATRAQDAGLEFVVKQTNREEHLLIGDGQRIRQILINLIGNAIKFTDHGKVSLTTCRSDDHLFFTVEDTGIGISPDILNRLFQRFEQADGSISRRFGGSGLGLFISRNLAEMMGGTINVSSQVRKGSIFELVLPYRSSTLSVKEERVKGDAHPVQEDKMRGHVLIAEDTPELQLLERRILEGIGLTVTTADNGDEAVKLASEHTFDLILMDMQMPEVDGIQATKVLRSQGNQIPIVALTANVMQKHREQFHQAGCNGFLAKPIDKKELNRVLRQFLNN